MAWIQPLAIGFALLAAIALVFWIVARARTERKLRALEREANVLRDSLRVSQEKYFSRKVDEIVFNELLSDYQQSLVEIEFQANALRGATKVNVDDALNKISKRFSGLTKSQKHRLQVLVEENQRVMLEIGELEKKLGKRELAPNAFRELSKRKQKQSIEAQRKIQEILKEPAP